MQIIQSEAIRPFDVDGTLILTKTLQDPPGSRYVEVYDKVEDKRIVVRVHEPNVRLLLEELSRGSHVIVWSRSGYEWAKAVLDAMNIDHERLLVMSKPLVYFDDMEVTEWLKDRVFLSPDAPYKK